MKYRSGLAAFLVSMCAAIPALAQDEGEGASNPPVIEGTPFYFSLEGAYLLSDKDRGAEDGYGGAIMLGKRMTSALNLELSASFLQTEAEQRAGLANNGDLKLNGLGANIMLFPSTTLPGAYALFGVGAGNAKGHPGVMPDYKTTYLDLGIGYLQPVIARKVYLRAEALYHMDKHTNGNVGVQTPPKDNGTFYDGIFRVGVLVPFGGAAATAEEPSAEASASEEAPAAEEAAAAGPTDSDGDGVPDDSDKCPDTPAGAVVNAEGCSDDADGDGVPDASDECPGTPAGAKVLANGCTLKDDCRTPTPGERVDANGCAFGLILRGVNFEFDSVRLTPTAKGILDESSATLKNYADIKVEVAGHTDNVGTSAYNQSLSERRANSVRSYIVGTGVEDSRMSSSGYGSSQPIDTNDTDEGRARNRRVELRPLMEESAAIAVPAAADAPVEAAPATEAPADVVPAAEEAAPSEEAPAAEAAPAEEAAPTEEAPAAEAATAEEAAPAEEAPAAEAAPAEEAAPTEEAPAAEAAPAEAAPADAGQGTEMAPEDAAVEMAPVDAPPSEEVPAELMQ